MARVLTIVGLIVVFTVSAFAAESDGSGIFLGGKIGPSAVMVLGEDTDDLDAAPGMGAGAVFKISLMDELALQAEFLYEMKGFSVDDADARQFLHYLSVPVMVKGVFAVDPVTVEPYAGLALSLLAGAEWEEHAGGGLDLSDSNTGDFNAIDLGVIFGAEMWFEVAESFYLTGDVRFAFGVIDIIDGSNDNGVYNFATSFLFGAAYRL